VEEEGKIVFERERDPPFLRSGVPLFIGAGMECEAR
jgi:hypothetical protein